MNIYGARIYIHQQALNAPDGLSMRALKSLIHACGGRVVGDARAQYVISAAPALLPDSLKSTRSCEVLSVDAFLSAIGWSWSRDERLSALRALCHSDYYATWWQELAQLMAVWAHQGDELELGLSYASSLLNERRGPARWALMSWVWPAISGEPMPLLRICDALDLTALKCNPAQLVKLFERWPPSAPLHTLRLELNSLTYSLPVMPLLEHVRALALTQAWPQTYDERFVERILTRIDELGLRSLEQITFEEHAADSSLELLSAALGQGVEVSCSSTV